MKRRFIVVVLAAFAMTFAERAHAQDPNAIDVWSRGVYRPFLSTTIDFGYLYLRPRLTVGWGRPFSTWFGAELNPIFVNTGLGFQGGLRAAFPFFDARVSARGFRSFDHGYLPNQPSYDDVDLVNASGNAVVITYDTELRAVIHVGPGEVGLLASLSTITNVPEGQLAYEETLHVIVKPPVVWRTRVGYTIFIKTGVGRLSITPVVDVLGVPARDVIMVRAGLLATFLINKHLEVRGAFVPLVASADGIGILGGDFTELGLRYRWATGP